MRPFQSPWEGSGTHRTAANSSSLPPSLSRQSDPSRYPRPLDRPPRRRRRLRVAVASAEVSWPTPPRRSFAGRPSATLPLTPGRAEQVVTLPNPIGGVLRFHGRRICRRPELLHEFRDRPQFESIMKRRGPVFRDGASCILHITQRFLLNAASSFFTIRTVTSRTTSSGVEIVFELRNRRLT